MCDIGLRVIRGPDWRWDDQDGGEGFVGTVTELGSKTISPDKTVIVLWDIGYKTNYRIGYNGSFDLRVFDNAPIGVIQNNVMCNACKTRDFSGIRFKCFNCYDYDLCFQCYMNDCHNLSHKFRRYDTATSNCIPIELPPRINCKKVEIKGLFQGSKVIRGQNWDWGDQDGGSGNVGNVIDVKGWDNETNRSVLSVTWSKTNITNLYRVGHKGKVDVTCVEAVPWGTCYIDHLPVLGENVSNVLRTMGSVVTFNSGEKVKVNVDEKSLRYLQDGHGGWNPRMVQYIGAIGTVHRVTEKGDIRVQFENCNNRWTFHPDTLIKVNNLKIGDNVRFINDISKIQELQKGHGEWLDVMENDLNKIGKITNIYADGDLRVSVEDRSWTVNPLCVELVPQIENINFSDSSEELKRAVSGITRVIHDLETTQDNSIEHVLEEVEKGNLEFLDKYFSKSKSGENVGNGKTCLHIACHEGQLKLVRFLLSIGATPETQDMEGDTALHFATYNNQPAVLEILLMHGTNPNLVNKNLFSALHVAVNRQFYQCAKVLLLFHSNPNLQDSFGDTALHDAVSKGDFDIVNLLCNNADIDYSLVNNQGFNVIHTCALKGFARIMDKLLHKAKSLVNSQKKDGFAPIHLSAINGYKEVTKILVTKGNADVNIRNGQQRTALHLAASQKRCSVVELLIKLDADINAEDENGNIPLHLALINKKSSASIVNNCDKSPFIYNIYLKLKNINPNLENSWWIAMICYLVQCGSNLKEANQEGVTPMHLLNDFQLMDLIQNVQLSTVKAGLSFDSSSEIETGEEITEKEKLTMEYCDTNDIELSENHYRSKPVECIVCSDLNDDNVTLEPCKHKLACEECTSRMKKCMQCGEVITKRITHDGRIVSAKSRQKSIERLHYLENKIAEIEEIHSCPICMERRRNVAFLCGHGSCDKCSATLTLCHMCRTVITKKINLY